MSKLIILKSSETFQRVIKSTHSETRSHYRRKSTETPSYPFYSIPLEHLPNPKDNYFHVTLIKIQLLYSCI